MMPHEIDECVNYGRPWPELVEVCMRCKKERPVKRAPMDSVS